MFVQAANKPRQGICPLLLIKFVRKIKVASKVMEDNKEEGCLTCCCQRALLNSRSSKQMHSDWNHIIILHLYLSRRIFVKFWLRCRAVSEGVDVVAEVVEGVDLAVLTTPRPWALLLPIYRTCPGRQLLCTLCVLSALLY